MSSRTAEPYDPLTTDQLVAITGCAVLATPVLRVTFDDGAVRDVDFTDIIARSRWFHTLALPTTFADVEVVNNGRALQWVTGADYCADALRLLGDQQLAAKGKT